MTAQEHIREDELQGFVDGRIGAERTLAVGTHVKECMECQRSLEMIRRVDGALHGMAYERTSASFTVSVMDRLGLSSSAKRRTSFFAYAASLLASLIVLGVLLSVFIWTGVIDTTQIAGAQSLGFEVVAKGGEAVSEAVGWFDSWIRTYLSFAFGKGSLQVSVSVVIVAVLLALIDYAARRRLSHRIR
jgi:anti-sigma factor RsiW